MMSLLVVPLFFAMEVPLFEEAPKPPGFEAYQFTMRTEPDDELLELDTLFIEITLKNVSDKPIPYVYVGRGYSWGNVEFSICPEGRGQRIDIPNDMFLDGGHTPYPMLHPGDEVIVFGKHGSAFIPAPSAWPHDVWMDIWMSEYVRLPTQELGVFRLQAKLLLSRRMFSDAVGPDGTVDREKARLERGHVTVDLRSKPIRLKPRPQKEKDLLRLAMGETFASFADIPELSLSRFLSFCYRVELERLEQIEQALPPGSARNAIHCYRMVKMICEPPAPEAVDAAIADLVAWIPTLPELE